MKRRFVFTEDSTTRLDRWLRDRLPDESRTVLARWIGDGYVRVNDREVKASHRLTNGDLVEIDPPEPTPSTLTPENIPLKIVYEDEWLAVIDKQAGLIVHPAPGVSSGTLANALLYHMRTLSSEGGAQRPGIVHRLDKDTTGLLVVAKDDRTHRLLSEALAKREVKRHYLALVHGRLPEERGTIRYPIGRSRNDTGKMAPGGRAAREACTHWERMENFSQTALVRCRLETGRTHQIRVHMQAIGHPIIGDPLYGRSKEKWNVPHQMLHAAYLSFRHPQTGETMEFQAEPPMPFAALLDLLRSESNPG